MNVLEEDGLSRRNSRSTLNLGLGVVPKPLDEDMFPRTIRLRSREQAIMRRDIEACRGIELLLI